MTRQAATMPLAAATTMSAVLLICLAEQWLIWIEPNRGHRRVSCEYTCPKCYQASVLPSTRCWPPVVSAVLRQWSTDKERATAIDPRLSCHTVRRRTYVNSCFTEYSTSPPAVTTCDTRRAKMNDTFECLPATVSKEKFPI